MIRRKFLQLLAISGTTALTPLESLATNSSTAIYLVKGFSCPTCAIGLDTLYTRTKGVLSSHSTYPEGKVTVRFDPDTIHEADLRAIITDAGFTIASHQLS